MRIRYLRQAEADLLDIFEIVATHDERAADRLIDRIRTAVLRLRDFPESARSREDLGGAIRSIPVSSYVIYYRVDQSSVHIVRVLHGARNANALLRNKR